MSYLIHFNGNHSSKNGQFVSGDGDKDGVIDDHHNYARNKNKGTKGDKPGTPVAKIDHPHSKVYTTKKGKGVVYVSPNGLKTGYWADAKTGKRLIGRTLFRSAPQEYRAKEAMKRLAYQGISDVASMHQKAGREYVDQYMADRVKY